MPGGWPLAVTHTASGTSIPHRSSDALIELDLRSRWMNGWVQTVGTRVRRSANDWNWPAAASQEFGAPGRYRCVADLRAGNVGGAD